MNLLESTLPQQEERIIDTSYNPNARAIASQEQIAMIKILSAQIDAATIAASLKLPVEAVKEHCQAPKKEITPDHVKEIKQLGWKEKMSDADIALKLEFDESEIHAILNPPHVTITEENKAIIKFMKGQKKSVEEVSNILGIPEPQLEAIMNPPKRNPHHSSKKLETKAGANRTLKIMSAPKFDESKLS